MVEVRLSTSNLDSGGMDRFARALGGRLRFVNCVNNARSGVARLHLTARRLPEPYRVCPNFGVVVSTWDCDGVCHFTGMPVENYLLLVSLPALAQWRALRRNPIMRIEDLRHPSGVRCVFAGSQTVQDFALMLDPPMICPGCVAFYHCLGADRELIALRQVIAEAVPASSAGRCPVVTRALS